MRFFSYLFFLGSALFVSPLYAEYNFNDWRYIDRDNWQVGDSYRGYKCNSPGFRIDPPEHCHNTYSHSDQVSACESARRRAIHYARHVVGPRGHHYGFIAGVNCGTNYGLQRGIGDSYALRFGASQVTSMIAEINSLAMEHAAPKGAEAGEAEGENRASKQYRDATRENGGNLPIYAEGNPDNYIQYAGESSGYSRFGGHRVRTEDEVLPVNVYFDPYSSFSSSQRDPLIQFFRYDRGYRQGRGYRLRDVYLGRDNRLRHRPYVGGDYSQLIDKWLYWADQNDHDAHRYYEHLDDAEGNNVVTGVKIESPKHVFEESMERFFPVASQVIYSRFYNIGLDYGYFDAFPVGEDAGRKIAEDAGRRDEYNRRFLIETESAYALAFDRQFRDSYHNAYEYWKTHSRVEGLSALAFLEENGNGINERNERLKLKFRVSNSGGADASVTISTDLYSSPGRARDRLSNARGGQIRALQQVVVPKLSHETVVTEFIQVAPVDIPLDQAKQRHVVSLTISMSDGTALSDEITLMVHKVLGLRSLRRTLRLSQGEMKTTFTLVNPRSIPSSEKISLLFLANGVEVDRASLTSLAANSSRSEMLIYTVTDPLTLLGTETTLDVQLKIEQADGTEELLQANALQPVSIDERIGLVEYTLAFGLLKAAYPGKEIRVDAEETADAEYREDAKKVQRGKVVARIKNLNQVDIDRLLTILESNQLTVGGPDLWSRGSRRKPNNSKAIFRLLSTSSADAIKIRKDVKKARCRALPKRSERNACSQNQSIAAAESATLQASLALIMEEQFCQLKSITGIQNSHVKNDRKRKSKYSAIERKYSGHVKKLVKNMLKGTGYAKTKQQRMLRAELGLATDKKNNLDCDVYLAHWLMPLAASK